MTPVVIANEDDIPAWLALASEVEPLFGQPVGESGFMNALHKNIARGTAYCIREAGSPPGLSLPAGLLFSPKPPLYTLSWLAVAGRCRRQGLGRALVSYALQQVVPPAEVAVITFGEGHPDGEPARHFYEALGFRAADAAPPGPDGSARQFFRLRFIP